MATAGASAAFGGLGYRTQAGQRPTWSDRLPRGWLFPVFAYALTWLVILAAWHASDAILGQSHPWTWHFLFKDAIWYQRIGQHGYAPTLRQSGTHAWFSGAFFPLLPLLVRLASYLVGGNFVIASLVVSIAAGAASAIGVWALAAQVRDRWVADRAVVLYCAFPGAMTFGTLYTEPLAVAISAAALLAMLRRRWLLAGLIGAAGTAARPTMLVLAAVATIAALQAIWTRREWRALLAPALTPLGVLAYFGYLGHRYHNYAFWFSIERRGWHQHIDWGVHMLHQLTRFDPQHIYLTVVLAAMSVAAAAGLAMMLASRLPLPVSLFGLLMVLACVVSSGTSTKPRFVLAAFPIFIGAAAKLPRALYGPTLALSAAGLFWVIGWWAAAMPVAP